MVGARPLVGKGRAGVYSGVRECCGFLGREESWRKITILRAETKLDSRLERDQPSSWQQNPVSSGQNLDVALKAKGSRVCLRSGITGSALVTITPP